MKWSENGEITVCAVDDDPDGAELVATRLEHQRKRLTVRTAQTAAEALQQFEAGDLDCIVSDFHLEETDGVEFLNQVRTQDSDFPFMLLTRTGTERAASDAISAGVTDYFVKGFADNQYELLAEAVVREVTRLEMEREAQRTERQLHELVDNTNDVLWMFSGDWTELLFVNSAYEELFGKSTESLAEEPVSFLDIVHPEDQDRVQQAIEYVLQGESSRVTYRIQREDGEIRWMESHGEPIDSGTETVARVAGFTRDITDRKRKEQRLQAKNEQLNLFTSVVAHDLRNPLNVAQGYLELAREDSDTQYLAAVGRSHDRMEQLITDLLTLARHGDSVNKPEPVSLSTLATAHWKNVASRDSTLDIQDEATIRADGSRLGQAFENLFRNAIEHAGDRVTVTVGLLDGRTGFYVEDDGPGIPEEDRKKLLSIERNSEGGKRKFGIEIVKRIVKAHGWNIEIVDASGGGARFEVTGVEVVKASAE